MATMHPGVCPKCKRPFATVEDYRNLAIAGKCSTWYAPRDPDVYADCERAARQETAAPPPLTHERVEKAVEGLFARPEGWRADDDEPVTEDWLRDTFGRHLASCDWKRYALNFATRFPLFLGWCPPCGNLSSCLCVNELVVADNPTRGHVRRLAAALGIELKEPLQ